MDYKKIGQLTWGLVSVYIIWYVMYLILDNVGVPSPNSVLVNTIKAFPEIMFHLSKSIIRISLSLLLSSIFGSILGYLMAENKWLDKVLSPIVYIFMPIPKIALYPVLLLILGLNETPKILIMVSVMIFQFVVSIKDSLQALPQDTILSAQSLSLTKKQYFQYIIIPSMLPAWFTAFRISFGISIAVLFFSETVVSTTGIGYYIMQRWGVINYLDMYSGIVVLSIFGLLIYECIDWAQYKLCPYLYLSNKN